MKAVSTAFILLNLFILAACASPATQDPISTAFCTLPVTFAQTEATVPSDAHEIV